MQVEFRNAAANSTTSNIEILASGCLVLTRENQGFFAMCPDGVMDEVVNTGGWTMHHGDYIDVGHEVHSRPTASDPIAPLSCIVCMNLDILKSNGN